MAKVFSVTPLELRPDVDEQEFIKFIAEQYAPLGARLGWKGYVLKADRGERDGKLAVIWEIPNVERSATALFLFWMRSTRKGCGC